MTGLIATILKYVLPGLVIAGLVVWFLLKTIATTGKSRPRE